MKRIRALRQRKERDRSGLFFVEGIRIVGEALEVEAPIEECVVAPDLLTSDFARRVLHRLQDFGVPVLEVTSSVFQTLSLRDNPQGIGAVIRQGWDDLHAVRPGGELCWIALTGVQDPGNLGAILRTSDAVGGAGVVLIGATADPYDPGAIRASMGAIFSQRLVRCSLDDLRGWKAGCGWHVVGTSDAASVVYREASYDAPLLLLMGSEREGLSREEMTLCDRVVRIPMMGRSDSLNLAVAAGVMLYEMFNRRHGD
ncbi:MAG: TrmH family RNA methyltransferase [Chloroflexota bacterium]